MFIKRYLLLFPIAIYCFYKMAFVRKNRFSDKNESKFFNKTCEEYVLGGLIERKIKQKMGHLVYKQETEETQLVLKCLDRHINENHLKSLIPVKKVKVVHDERVIATFMNFDQTLYITTETLKLAEMNEGALALFIAHELTHYLQEHQVQRLLSMLRYHYMIRPFIRLW